MSIIAITAAIETALNGMSPAISTAWPNVEFIPITDVEYQYIDIISDSENPTQGSDFYREEGFIQVMLMYPLERGAIPSNTRVELLRSTFKRGNSFVSDGITVHIDKTPSKFLSEADGDRYKTVVRIEFHADVCG